MKFFLGVIIVWGFVSCNFLNSDELVGTYVATNQVYNSDTLILFKDGSYTQIVKRIKEGGNIHNKGYWSYESRLITLLDYYPDDDDGGASLSNYQKVLMTVAMEVEKSNNRIKIYHRVNNIQSFYEKIK